jgi:hypothetical protein
MSMNAAYRTNRHFEQHTGYTIVTYIDNTLPAWTPSFVNTVLLQVMVVS